MPPNPIEGTWVPIKAELDGEHAPDLALARIRLVIAAGTYAVSFGKEITDRGSYQLHGAQEPHTLTLQGEHGANQGRTIPSIYQLAGNRLRICFGLDGTIPSSFAAPAGSKCYLVFYRRQET